MVEKRFKNVKGILNTYRKKLEEKKIKVQKMILFGSYARRSPRDYSDIDVAIISKDFKGKQRDYLLLDRTAREVTSLIEAFPYTPKDLKNREPGSFLDEILKTGKVVYSRSS